MLADWPLAVDWLTILAEPRNIEICNSCLVTSGSRIAAAEFQGRVKVNVDASAVYTNKP